MRRGVRVLVVEDHPTNMILMESFLAYGGHEIIKAEDGMSGIVAAREQCPQIVFMDLRLPDMTGFEVLAVLRGDANTRHLPIVALTGSAMEGDLESGLAAGFDEYITKPFQYKHLLQVIEELALP